MFSRSWLGTWCCGGWWCFILVLVIGLFILWCVGCSLTTIYHRGCTVSRYLLIKTRCFKFIVVICSINPYKSLPFNFNFSDTYLSKKEESLNYYRIKLVLFCSKNVILFICSFIPFLRACLFLSIIFYLPSFRAKIEPTIVEYLMMMRSWVYLNRFKFVTFFNFNLRRCQRLLAFSE